jgi:ribonuclease VapC
MMVDTSAILAIMLSEGDAGPLAERIEKDVESFVTLVVEIEAATVLAGRLTISVPAALADVRKVLKQLNIQCRPLAIEASDWAADAYERFGKGRHPAKLNLGDCLSYGAARAAGVGLIYKGQDFAQTDLA